MSKTIKTSKGSELPLMNLKGKDYLQVAYRLQWLSDDNPNYTIETEFAQIQDTYAVCKATVKIFSTVENKETGIPTTVLVRQASATKQENVKDFKDFMEKAETGAIGRALAMLGLGTQHAVSDLDEGDRIVDSPLTAPSQVQSAPAAAPASKPSFRKPAAAPTQAAPAEGEWV